MRHLHRTMPWGFILGHWGGPCWSTLSVQYNPLPRRSIWYRRWWRSKLGRHLWTLCCDGIRCRWESACRWGMPCFYQRYGDNTDFLVGALSRIPANCVSELIDSLIYMVAAWPTAWVAHCLGVPLKLYM